MSKIISCILAILLFVGCTIPSGSPPPDVEIPESWRFLTNEGCTCVNINWWMQFQDPVLDNLIVEALDNNKDLMVAIARVYEFAGLLGIENARLFPEIDGEATALRQEISAAVTPVPPGKSRTSNFFSIFLSAFYEVDLWGKIRSANRAAWQDLLASVENRRVVVLTLVTSVAGSYVTLRQYDKQLEISKATLHARQEATNYAQVRYDQGETSEMEVKQALFEQENALVRIKQLEILIAQQEDLISVLLGRSPGDIVRGSTLESFVLPPCVPAGLPSELLNQRPDILQAQHFVEAADARVSVAKTLYFPDITLTGNYGNESLHLRDLLTGRALTWQYAANVFEPIFTAGRIASQIEVAKAIELEALHTYEQTVLTAFQEVDDALIAHQVTLELLQIQFRRVEVLQDYLSLAKMRYSEGENDYLTVLDAERNLFAAQLDLAQTQSNTIVTLINIYKALGGGWIVAADYNK
jgi:outer membrane protein, multidrug efflux system